MDFKTLSQRYKTPSIVKVIGTILFPLVFIIMLVLPVFELIPADTFKQLAADGEQFSLFSSGGYESTKYTMFGMLSVDYGNIVSVISIIVLAVAVIVGVGFLWVNRAKLSIISTSVMVAAVIFAGLRNFAGTRPAEALIKPDVYFKGMDPIPLKDTFEYISQYVVDGAKYVYNILAQDVLLWVAALVLLAFSIVAIVITKEINPKKAK